MLLQYHSVVDKEGNVYKEIVAFVVVQLKQSTHLSLFKPFYRQAKPTQKSHLTDNGWPRKLVITLTVS